MHSYPAASRHARLGVLAPGVIHPRVEAVGPRHFGIVAVDCAKDRSRWMVTDFYGRVLHGPQTVEHRATALQAAVEATRQAARAHDLRDLIVAVERTGTLHLIPRRAWAAAGFEVRTVDPLATRRFRQPADPGTKTDGTDLAAIVRAAVNGFGLLEPELPEAFLRLRLLARHRRDLVDKHGALRCQIQDPLHALWPGYATCFDDIFTSEVALLLPQHFTTPAALLEAGWDGLQQVVHQAGVRCQGRTLEAILAWAQTAAPGDDEPDLRRRIVVELDQDRRSKRAQIAAAERDMAKHLIDTEYLILLSIPGINVVTAGDFAAEAGPVAGDASARAVTGRAGLYPSRYQSAQVDRRDGPLVRCGNRRLRQALLRIADTLMRCNDYYRARAQRWLAGGKPPRAVHVRVADRFCRLAYRMLAGGQAYRHPSGRPRDYIIQKLMRFHNEHLTSIPETVSDLQAAVGRLPRDVRAEEASSLTAELAAVANQRGAGPRRLGEILPAVLVKLRVWDVESPSSGELTRTD